MKIFGLAILLMVLPIGLNAEDKILKWRDNSSNEDIFYVMERIGPSSSAWNVLAVMDPNVTTFKVTMPDLPKAKVCYQIVAGNDVGESKPSNIACTKIK